jgi:hypothetical protein
MKYLRNRNNNFDIYVLRIKDLLKKAYD